MKQRGLVATLAIVLALISVFSLSHTFYVFRKECDVKLASGGNAALEKQKLAELSAKDTTNLIVTKYTYADSKQKELNLGLDLKGGINMTLQISEKDLLNNLSSNSKNPIYLQAIAQADALQKSSDKSYMDAFFAAYYSLVGGTNTRLAASDMFGNSDLSQSISGASSDKEVEKVIREKVEASVSKAYEIIRARIDRFGVAQPNVQRIEGTGRILVELPGIKDIDRAKNLLQSTAKLEFWEAYRLYDPKTGGPSPATAVGDKIIAMNPKLVGSIKNEGSSFAVNLKDTASVSSILKSEAFKLSLPTGLKTAKILWGAKADETNGFLPLYVINGNRTDKALLDGGVVTSSKIDRDMINNQILIQMTMNSDGAQKWSEITDKFKATTENSNDGKLVAVVLDDMVYTAPQINSRIPNGISTITGNFTMDEVTDLTNILNAGSLPARANIIQSEIVGPSMGEQAIEAGYKSFVIALILVFVWMIFYYAKAGFYADLALILNLFLIFGILASIGGVLTLPGIAGIVLTMAVAVDGNIILNERVKEELKSGKTLKEAVGVAYSTKGGLSSILDANVTTFITALVLYFVGEGPVKGFATTLMIGIATSVFTGVFVTRLFIDAQLEKGNQVSFTTKLTENWFQGYTFDYLKFKNKAYIISGILVAVSIFSIIFNGMDYGIDFVGGRNYTIKFDKAVNPQEIEKALSKEFVDEKGNVVKPLVKNSGASNQIQVSTRYKIDDTADAVDSEIESKLYKGCKNFLPAGISLETFAHPSDNANLGVMSVSKVGPTIADDIKKGGFKALFISLVFVFLYILLRFKKWQFSMGAVLAVFHDAIITMGVFSMFKHVLPFSLEVDQTFIAAILTVIGYSLNDTVIVFDRIREYISDKIHGAKPFGQIINDSINATLTRTINTSMIALFVVLVIFLFGGDSIRGFMFALLVGISVGTYSSIFVATPLMYDLSAKEREEKAKEAKQGQIAKK